MRLSSGFFLSVLAGFCLASVKAPFYIFHEHDLPNRPEVPILSPNQAILVLAQRLGLSNHHSLGSVSESTLSYINKFGGKNSYLFDNSERKIKDLILIVEGISSEAMQPLLDKLLFRNPDFHIRDPSSLTKLIRNSEFKRLTENIEDSKSLKTAIDSNKSQWPELRSLFDRRQVNAAILFIPEPTSSTEINPSESELNENVLKREKRAVEKSMISSTFSLSSIDKLGALNSSKKTLKSLLPFCFNSLDTCISSTKNCSGHGECISKSGERDKQGACFTCKCRATNETVIWAKGTKKGWKFGYWGGSACHKEDVSSSFWLVSIFTIVMLGVITWGITMLYSIGEESLPGVIGAGVSSGKSRQN
ncbi:hypothetical protein OnM2_030044 [Erysiphe neolycopersici]|uniref:Uncharacterized protein n=1 Tax=Erysiphe neolycopersici TaxID=212602 RepID=A0A420HZF5_9PEZI|nr:hypothetical protein OnM2_030044 [Erysiphe neolycopersici]